ncbi:helix-turn-helix domain-containing protein, partial [Cyanobium sp. T1G-Tous]|uniref:helix-turn-helix domain-containing protein n=1 Tax=Cyanobium sp. T1G-Tous TaxID=2823722 RepID=UPI0020CB832F
MTRVLSPLEQSSRDAALETPEDVQMILGLSAAGWVRRRIAKELGCSPETVRKYRRQGGWEAYGKPRRNGVLDGQCDW